jgi:hypothetical protein
LIYNEQFHNGTAEITRTADLPLTRAIIFVGVKPASEAFGQRLLA